MGRSESGGVAEVPVVLVVLVVLVVPVGIFLVVRLYKVSLKVHNEL